MVVQKNPRSLKETLVMPTEVAVIPPPAKDLLAWESSARPFKKRGREYFTTIAAIVFLVSVILLFIKELLLIAVIIALMFVSYVLATVEPEKIKHKITTRGIKTGDKTYKWEDFSRFWFVEKWGHVILNIDLFRGFPSRLQLLLGNLKKTQLRKVIEKYLLYEKPEKTMMDKAGKWLQEKVPLETEK